MFKGGDKMNTTLIKTELLQKPSQRLSKARSLLQEKVQLITEIIEIGQIAMGFEQTSDFEKKVNNELCSGRDGL